MASGQPYRLSLFAAPQRKQAHCRNLGRTRPMSKKVMAWRIKIWPELFERAFLRQTERFSTWQLLTNAAQLGADEAKREHQL